MKITYSYPSLNYVERSGRRPRFEIYRHWDRANVPDVTSADAPVAAICESAKHAKTLIFRTYAEKLYARVEESIETALASEMETRMLYRFAEAVLPNRHGYKKKMLQSSGKDARPAIWEAWRMHRKNLLQKTRIREIDEYKPAQWLSPLELGEGGPEDVSDWGDVAREIVDSFIVIAGELWATTHEPMLSTQYQWDGVTFEYEDFSAFEQYKNAPPALPRPYGERNIWRHDLYGRFMREEHKYWNPNWIFAPISAANKSNVDRTQITFEAVIPELFTSDISPMLVDRAARLAVVFWEQEFMTFGDDDERFVEMEKTVKTLKKLTKLSPHEMDHEQAISVLRGLREMIPEPHWYQRDMDINQSVSVGIRTLIQNASHYWDERPVSVPSNLKSVQPLKP